VGADAGSIAHGRVGKPCCVAGIQYQP